MDVHGSEYHDSDYSYTEYYAFPLCGLSVLKQEFSDPALDEERADVQESYICVDYQEASQGLECAVCKYAW